MPKVMLSAKQQKRNEFINKSKAAIKKYTEIACESDDSLAEKLGVTVRTMQNRARDPGSMQLRDLWELAIILKCPVGELCGGELPEELIGKWMAKAMQEGVRA